MVSTESEVAFIRSFTGLLIRKSSDSICSVYARGRYDWPLSFSTGPSHTFKSADFFPKEKKMHLLGWKHSNSIQCLLNESIACININRGSKDELNRRKYQ